jgi:hypothetical protein
MDKLSMALAETSDKAEVGSMLIRDVSAYRRLTVIRIVQ